MTEENSENFFDKNLKSKNSLNDGFSPWVHCICVVTFDLELGQVIESIHPPCTNLAKQEIANICYLAFPDSNSGCMGDTQFTIRLRRAPGQGPVTKKQSAFWWGYVFFRQVKDPSLPRGYFQKSVVVLSYLPLVSALTKVCATIALEYFDNGNSSLDIACSHIGQWPLPTTGPTLDLALHSTVLKVSIPSLSGFSGGSQISGCSNNGAIDICQMGGVVLLDTDALQCFLPILSHVQLLWELVLTAEPLVVFASMPTTCSSMVLALVSMISPLVYSAEHRPYFTIHDSEFKEFTSNTKEPPSAILGVTNPFFAKTLQHWPHTIRLCEGNGAVVSQKIKKNNSNNKMLDWSPGVYTQYKPFLQKDKVFVKKLLLGIRLQRPPEVQTAMLRRHLLELTQSFMIPLERYMASLMPLQKSISPFKVTPSPQPFNPEKFLSTLIASGPQLTSGVKGNWEGLYRRFFRSSNFNSWFNTRYTELSQKLYSLQLQALSVVDLKQWVQNKPEVEIVDMVLNIRDKLSPTDNKPTQIANVDHDTREQLMLRLNELLEMLPDDLKNILQMDR